MWLDPPNAHTVHRCCGFAAICGAPFNEVCVKGYRRDFLLIFVSGITEGSAVLLLSIQIFNVISWNGVCLTQSLRILCWAPRGAIMQPLPFALPPTNNIYPAAQPSWYGGPWPCQARWGVAELACTSYVKLPVYSIKMQSIILCISVNCEVAKESSVVTFHCVLLMSVF